MFQFRLNVFLIPFYSLKRQTVKADSIGAGKNEFVKYNY